jgi:hypothetical protein
MMPVNLFIASSITLKCGIEEKSGKGPEILLPTSLILLSFLRGWSADAGKVPDKFMFTRLIDVTKPVSPHSMPVKLQ